MPTFPTGCTLPIYGVHCLPFCQLKPRTLLEELKKKKLLTVAIITMATTTTTTIMTAGGDDDEPLETEKGSGGRSDPVNRRCLPGRTAS